MYRLHKDHILPTVRIQKVVLDNFKCVHHGEIVFNCGRKYIPKNTRSDILGIYGQNGSGKTSLIEALSILKSVLSGNKISEVYTKCIDVSEQFAKLEFTFDFQYPKPINAIKTVVYSFKIEAVDNEPKTDESEKEAYYRKVHPKKIRVFDEKISASGIFCGEDQKMQPIFTADDTSQYAFGPSRKISEYIGSNKDKLAIDLAVLKREASKESRSFAFSEDTIKVFLDNGDYSEYLQILLELKHFGNLYLYVVDKRRSRADSLKIPFNTRRGIIGFSINRPTVIPNQVFNEMVEYSSQINVVLSQIIPGMQLVFRDRRSFYDDIPEDDKFATVGLYSKRGDKEIPLHYESEGIIKLVSVLSLIISAFNDSSCTIAIDELDAGIYEYLLGEILIAFEEYGQGQFIFTSHNLRPLEVLSKENLMFTTANPDRRYIRLKGVGKTNNLRNLYLREILDCNQDEEMYSSVKRYRLVAAFQKAGGSIGEE